MSEILCYHCGLPVPEPTHLYVNIEGHAQAMCCPGCQAVAQTIVEAGLQDFYTYRTKTSPTGQLPVPDFLQKIKVYDNPEVQKRFVHYEQAHLREAALILEGITCAACIWLNERHLRTLPGLLEVQVNYSTHRARVRWDDSQIHLSDILQAIHQIGYLAHPYDPTRQQEILTRERQQQLRRIGVAGVLGMQVMMFSIALYAGNWYGMETQFRNLFYWINLLLTCPILFYCAQPFFKNAWRDLSHRQVGMDVPVSLGLILAFVGSVWTTLWNPQGQVYYDSVSMFVFFLLTGRYFEFIARQKSTQATESLVHLVPTMAIRFQLSEEGLKEELVLVSELTLGDRVFVRPGENIPTDGILLEGHTQVNESLLTGESHPIPKAPGQTVLAGTINIDNPIQVQVTKVGEETFLSHILRLLERAQTEKPSLTYLADQVAPWFITGILFFAIIVAFYWWQVNADWLTITLSVLVVTCPCALSLATPTAMTAATSTLTRLGLLITRGHALETLARATHFVFDKTGTLTTGKLKLLVFHPFGTLSKEVCLQHVLAIEYHSEHPIAQALLEGHTPASLPLVEEVKNYPGAGMQGEIAGHVYFIGTYAFIVEKTGLTLELSQLEALQQEGNTLVFFADTEHFHAVFELGDQIRPGARELIQALQHQGKIVSLLSGDHAQAVQRVAQTLGIQNLGFALMPEDKLRHIKALQNQGAIVAMIGDGVNDAPVLAQAQVSIAMGGGTQVARASADMILLTEHLTHLILGMHTVNKMFGIIRQNLIWALGYNLLALPAAAMGWVAPWLAALGMSFSSLLVIGNSLRLISSPPRQ